MKLNLFKKKSSEVKEDKKDLPQKSFHPGRLSLWDLLKINRTVKLPIARK